MGTKVDNSRAVLESFWRAAIGAVSGRRAVAAALQADPPFTADLIIAVGKAAASMVAGALENLPVPCPALVVTKYGHADPSLQEWPNVTVLEAGHPIPDQNSLKAGKHILEAVRSLTADEKLLLLISGGASALAEDLPETVSLEDLSAMTRDMVASGATIAEINARRRDLSRIKGGQLLEHFQGSAVCIYALSDVAGDDIATIGSGLGDPANASCPTQVRIIGSNRIARQAAAGAAQNAGFDICHNEETLYGDVFDVASRIAATLTDAAPGIYIWGGEPTIQLPAHPGNGGRSQSLALAVAREIMGRDDIMILVAGTDGTDGPTKAAGAIIHGKSCDDPDAASQKLEAADAGPYLNSKGALFITGPTGTNVMDIVIAVVANASG